MAKKIDGYIKLNIPAYKPNGSLLSSSKKNIKKYEICL